jgi:O-antigen/teichoic acid export membrane protein
VDAEAFGAFAAAYLTYNLVLAVERSVVVLPMTIRVSSRSRQADEVAGAVPASFLAGCAGGLVMVAFGLAVGGQVRDVVCVYGVFMPVLCVQDTWRFVFVTMSRPAAAVVNDLVWGVVLIGGLVIALPADPAIGWLATVWAASALVAALVGGLQARVRPRWSGAVAYLRRHIDLGWRYAVESVVSSGSWMIATLMLGVLVSAEAVGSLRGAQTLFGPWTTLHLGLLLAAVPEGARLLARRPAALARALHLLSFGLAALALVWMAAVLLIPDEWGRALLGSTWPGAQEVILPVGTLMLGLGVFSGSIVGLRVLEAARESLRLRLVGAGVSIAAAALGAVVAGAPGGAWGIACGPWVNGLIAWTVFGRLHRRLGTEQQSALG